MSALVDNGTMTQINKYNPRDSDIAHYSSELRSSVDSTLDRLRAFKDRSYR
jgi:hypothetical protein